MFKAEKAGLVARVGYSLDGIGFTVTARLLLRKIASAKSAQLMIDPVLLTWKIPTLS